MNIKKVCVPRKDKNISNSMDLKNLWIKIGLETLDKKDLKTNFGVYKYFLFSRFHEYKECVC